MRKFTNEQLDQIVEGLLDKLEKHRQNKINKHIENDPYMKWLNKEINRLDNELDIGARKLAKKNKSAYKAYIKLTGMEP